MPKYLHKAFDILESPATRNAFSQRSMLCYLQFEREDFAMPKPSPLFPPRHILQGMYAIRVINENSLRFYVSSVLTKWQSICYSRCFHVIPIGKSQSFESELLFFECFDFFLFSSHRKPILVFSRCHSILESSIMFAVYSSLTRDSYGLLSTQQSTCTM